jgi:hypothetical protein
MKSSWNNEYYDIMNFYYWEPQHLGKIKNQKSKIQNIHDALSHIAKMEVSLNHQFNLFFQLLPSTILNDIINKVGKNYVSNDKLLYQSIADISILNLMDATQPDVFFKSNKDLVAIEFKLGSKSSIEQIVKYATLFHFTELYHKVEYAYHLVYVGCDSFSAIFKEKFSSIDLVQSAIEMAHIPDATRKGDVNLIPHKEKIIEIAKSLHLSFVSYQNLYNIFSDCIKYIDASNPFSETIIKLLSGMNNELVFRELARE